MRLLAEHLHEVLEREIEAVLRLERLELRHARLRADDELERRHDVDDQLAVRVDGRVDRLAPRRDLLLALGQQLLHEILQRGDERAERHVLLQQIELARDEVAALPRDRLVDLLHERRLADAGLARDHDRLDAAARDALEARQQDLRLGAAPVELLRRIEAVDGVGAAEREALDRSGRRRARRGSGADPRRGRAALW